MGHCLSKDSDTPRKIGNPLIQSSSTKFYSSNSTLKLQIKSWFADHLPNLRYIIGMTTKSHQFKEDTRIMFNSRINSTIVQNLKTQNLANIPDSHNYRFQPKTVLQLKVNRTKSGFRIEFVNEAGYELLTRQRQINLGQKFYSYGLQYQLVDLVNNKKTTQKQSEDFQQTQSSTDLIKSSDLDSEFNNKISLKQKPTCRICLQKQVTDQNPFVSPCDCIGSVRYSHLNCWKKWIMSIEQGNKYYCRWSITKQRCELCKKDFITNKQYRKKVISLLQPSFNLSTPYVVLKAVQPNSSCLLTKIGLQKLSFIYISFADKKKFTVGTSEGVDIPLSGDIGKGRRNAQIQLKGGKVILHDSTTKYGTYFKTKDPVMIKDDVPRHFLYKNNILTFKLE